MTTAERAGGSSPIDRVKVAGVTPRRVGELYRFHFQDPRRERQFLSSLGFATTFTGVRLLTHAIRRGWGPARNIQIGGRHVHHLVFGIAGLLGTGYLWLLEVGTGNHGPWSAVTSITYGSSSALTLDEFALWLNLEDVYWARQGRESIDAVVIFGAVLSVGFWGGPFVAALAREFARR